MTKRAYQMGARAEATRATRSRIIRSAVLAFFAVGREGLKLDDVARDAEVTVRTLLRHFGSKEGLLASAVEELRVEVLKAREVPEGAGLEGALATLFAVYEAYGDLNWQLLRHEGYETSVSSLLAEAREVHREWLARAFADYLPRRSAERTRRLDLLFAATDFYTWKLYRRDLGYSRARSERLIRHTVQRLCEGFEEGESS